MAAQAESLKQVNTQKDWRSKYAMALRGGQFVSRGKHWKKETAVKQTFALAAKLGLDKNIGTKQLFLQVQKQANTAYHASKIGLPAREAIKGTSALNTISKYVNPVLYFSSIELNRDYMGNVCRHIEVLFRGENNQLSESSYSTVWPDKKDHIVKVTPLNSKTEASYNKYLTDQCGLLDDYSLTPSSNFTINRSILDNKNLEERTDNKKFNKEGINQATEEGLNFNNNGLILISQIALTSLSGIATVYIMNKGRNFYLSSETLLDKVKSLGLFSIATTISVGCIATIYALENNKIKV